MQLSLVFYNINDDPRQINEARTTMLGATAVWFINLAKFRPELLVVYSAFLADSRQVYLCAQHLENPCDHLRSLHVTGPMQEFVADLNAWLACCPTVVHPLLSISNFHHALLAAVAAELKSSQVTCFGGRNGWPNLVEIQSGAATLAAYHPQSTTADTIVTLSPIFAQTSLPRLPRRSLLLICLYSLAYQLPDPLLLLLAPPLLSFLPPPPQPALPRKNRAPQGNHQVLGEEHVLCRYCGLKNVMVPTAMPKQQWQKANAKTAMAK